MADGSSSDQSNPCLSPLKLRVCFLHVMSYSLSVTYDRSVVFSNNKIDHYDITEILLENLFPAHDVIQCVSDLR
jgi:hypothetical protein